MSAATTSGVALAVADCKTLAARRSSSSPITETMEVSFIMTTNSLVSGGMTRLKA